MTVPPTPHPAPPSLSLSLPPPPNHPTSFLLSLRWTIFKLLVQTLLNVQLFSDCKHVSVLFSMWVCVQTLLYIDKSFTDFNTRKTLSDIDSSDSTIPFTRKTDFLADHITHICFGG